MDDREITARISQLIEQEHQLERAHVGQRLSEPELQRLRSVEVALDECWDLLRQRRARRAAGLDPDGATHRGAGTVETYLQ
jgi:Protein of unknown function (DUF2630)